MDIWRGGRYHGPDHRKSRRKSQADLEHGEPRARDFQDFSRRWTGCACTRPPRCARQSASCMAGSFSRWVEVLMLVATRLSHIQGRAGTSGATWTYWTLPPCALQSAEHGAGGLAGIQGLARECAADGADLGAQGDGDGAVALCQTGLGRAWLRVMAGVGAAQPVGADSQWRG